MSAMSNKTRKELMRTQTRASFPYLIEVYLPNGTLRLANASHDITYDGNTYQSSYFTVTPPSRSNSTVTDGDISFSTIDQTWIERVRTINERIKVRFIAIMEHDYIEPLDDIVFTLLDANWNERKMSFTMMLDDRMNVQIPYGIVSARTVPALA